MTSPSERADLENAPTPSRRRRSLLPITVLLVAAVGIAGIVVDRRTQPVLLAGPMVQTPRPDTLTFTWQMRATFTEGGVRLEDASGAVLTETVAPTSDRYEVSFTGLPAGAAYAYTVFNSGFLGRRIEVAGPFEVATSPPPGKPFRFIAFGDSGVGTNSQAGLADLITAQKPDLVIHVGDLIYPAGARKDYRLKFFEPNAALVRSTPFMPVLGNHDYATDQGRPLLDCFVLPSNGPDGIEPERNYWFDFGDARFVALDSNKIGNVQGAVLTEEQMKTVVAPWARQVLANCDARWKFAYFHHPFYTNSEHSAEGGAYFKEAFVDVFEECGVDMVFVGHNHLYERTAPIRDDNIVEPGKGVVYITTGAGGAKRYPEHLPPPEYIKAYNDEVLSFTQVDLTADRLELKQLDDRGRVLDEFVIETPAAALRTEPRP